jgi:PTH1 family peptidyl-tRNA hydrolase
MKLVLGIGNYGDIYKDTRHNSGFQALDLFTEDTGIEIRKHDFKSLVGKGNIFGEDVLLLKPLTYVNLSGEALSEAMRFYKLTPKDIIILVDDMDTEPGNVRLKTKGSAGGHNGLKNIIQHLGTEEFDRIRIGIGRPPHSDNPNRIVDYVLQSPKDSSEYMAWKDGISKACEALEYTLKYDFVRAMNKYNSEVYTPKLVKVL